MKYANFAAYGLMAFAGLTAAVTMTGYGIMTHAAIAHLVARLLAF